MKTRTYRVVATGCVHVSTNIEASSKAEALRKAKAMPESDWKCNMDPIDLEGHEVTDVPPAKMRLSGPMVEMLRAMQGWADSTGEHGQFWCTGGLGGARVANPLRRRGLVVLGQDRSGYPAARINPQGRAALALHELEVSRGK